MRIIGGTAGGRVIRPPKGLPVRPTTDLAKEAIFNWIGARREFEELNVLELFCGTGNMGLEFASREAISVICVDRHPGCVNYVKQAAKEFGFSNLTALKGDALKFSSKQTFQLIFADPPYDIPEMRSIPDQILAGNLLEKGGLFILEHRSNLKFEGHPKLLVARTYGQSVFSIFEQ